MSIRPPSSLPAVIEQHDRSRFEVVGFALNTPEEDAMHARLRSGFDRFVDLRDCRDAEAAELAWRAGVDIAIDLGGHTRAAVAAYSSIEQRRCRLPGSGSREHWARLISIT